MIQLGNSKEPTSYFSIWLLPTPEQSRRNLDCCHANGCNIWSFTLCRPSTSPTEAWTAVRCTCGPRCKMGTERPLCDGSNWCILSKMGHEGLLLMGRWLVVRVSLIFGGYTPPKIHHLKYKNSPHLKDLATFWGTTWFKQILDEAPVHVKCRPTACRIGWPKGTHQTLVRRWTSWLRTRKKKLLEIGVSLSLALYIVRLQCICFHHVSVVWRVKIIHAICRWLNQICVDSSLHFFSQEIQVQKRYTPPVCWNGIMQLIRQACDWMVHHLKVWCWSFWQVQKHRVFHPKKKQKRKWHHPKKWRSNGKNWDMKSPNMEHGNPEHGKTHPKKRGQTPPAQGAHLPICPAGKKRHATPFKVACWARCSFYFVFAEDPSTVLSQQNMIFLLVTPTETDPFQIKRTWYFDKEIASYSLLATSLRNRSESGTSLSLLDCSGGRPCSSVRRGSILHCK